MSNNHFLQSNTSSVDVPLDHPELCHGCSYILAVVPKNMSGLFSSSHGIDNFRIKLADSRGAWSLESGQSMKQMLSLGQTEVYRFVSLTQGMMLDILVFSGKVRIEVTSPTLRNIIMYESDQLPNNRLSVEIGGLQNSL